MRDVTHDLLRFTAIFRGNGREGVDKLPEERLVEGFRCGENI